MKKEAQTPISNRGFDGQILSKPPYHDELYLPGIVASIDNVRLKYTYRKSDYNHATGERNDSIVKLLEMLTANSLWLEGCFDIHHMQCNFRIGNYAHTVTYNLADGSSFSVLVGRYCADSSVKQCAPEAILDFNPNKIPVAVWTKITGILSAFAVKTEVQRFDLALDFPVERSALCLNQRSGSKYSKVIDANGAITEYTGERSKHGAVKLYDKASEIGLSTPLTRLELTISLTKMKNLKKLMPTIVSLAPLELSMCLDELPFEVQAVIIHPDLIDRLRASVSRHTWAKYKAMISDYGQTFFTIPDEQLDQIEKYVRSYLARLPSAHLHQGVNV